MAGHSHVQWRTLPGIVHIFPVGIEHWYHAEHNIIIV